MTNANNRDVVLGYGPIVIDSGEVNTNEFERYIAILEEKTGLDFEIKGSSDGKNIIIIPIVRDEVHPELKYKS